jgi:transcriptional accessory protein Tex/SPT6
MSEEVATMEPIVETPEAEASGSTASEAASLAVAESEASSPATVSAIEETEKAASSIVTILTLEPGQKLSGKVKNITSFGAFVDIGLPQDGLVHISELARKKVENVSDIVSVGQEVDVWVKKVDQKRGRISLTMIKPLALRLKDIVEEAELEGVVTRLESYGAFIDIGTVRDGLVHISQITHDYVKHPQEVLAVGDKVKVKVIKVNRKKRQIDLSIKALLPPPEEKVEEPPPPVEEPKVEEIPEAEEIEDESVPTAMAMAYAAMQSRHQSVKSVKSVGASDEGKRKKEMDDIIARTLATGKQ